jgi:[acyl-carrier-protein] S-malonyltransferase
MSFTKIALLFPGQGSQFVGMGKNENQNYLSKANEVLKYDLQKICLEGPEELLKQTENTQPAIFTHSVTLLEKIKPLIKKYPVCLVAGHSVGEYAALYAAGVISFNDGVRAVHYRGKFMQDAVPFGMGKMYAILRANEEIVRNACLACSDDREQVMPANFNDPEQTVISGHANACDKVVEWLKTNGGEKARAIELKVSAPFHSTLMKPAAEKLKSVIAETKFNTNTLPYLANIDAKLYNSGTSVDIIKTNLINQVSGSVLWSHSMKQIAEDTLCLEVGPGKVLAGLMKKINPQVKILSLDDEKSYAEFLELIK